MRTLLRQNLSFRRERVEKITTTIATKDGDPRWPERAIREGQIGKTKL